MRDMKTWRNRFLECMKDFNGDKGRSLMTIRAGLLEYFRSPEGLAHIADSPQQGKDPETVTALVMQTVRGWANEVE